MSVRARSRALVQRLALRLVDAGLQVMGDLRSRISPPDSSNQLQSDADAGECTLAPAVACRRPLAEEIRAIGRRYPHAMVSAGPFSAFADALAGIVEYEGSGTDPRLNGGTTPTPAEPELPPAAPRTPDYIPRRLEVQVANVADRDNCLVVLLEREGYKPFYITYPEGQASEVRPS